MRVLLIHNAYQLRGGEDAVVAAEAELLASAGHTVDIEIVSNDELSGPIAKARAFLDAPYSKSRESWANTLVAKTGADIVHVHNFFPLLTLAVHTGAARAGAATVQTLHNYRLMCADARLLRNGNICEKCVTGSNIWGAIHRCYRGSIPGSVAAVRMQRYARKHSILANDIHKFIALTDFAKEKFCEFGLSREKISIKPNFTSDPGSNLPDAGPRSGALFVGRLSEEKGAATLVEAWKSIPGINLTVVGDGPCRAALEAASPPNVMFTGALPPDVVRRHMAQAALLVVPSIWYEPFGLVVIEAFAAGLPVASSNIGSLPELVRDGFNGKVFTAGDPVDLQRAVDAFFSADDHARFGENARRDYLELYSPIKNLNALENIYLEALEARRQQNARIR